MCFYCVCIVFNIFVHILYDLCIFIFLYSAYKKLQDIARNVANISFECKIDIDPDEYVKDVSKVNILYKIEQYKDYFKFKGL